jgi:integrase
LPRLLLTDITIRSLKAPARGQVTYWDKSGALKGFGIRLGQGNSRTFVVMKGKQRKLLTVGRYPALSLSKARDEARKIIAFTPATPFKEEPCPSFAETIPTFLTTHFAPNRRRERTKMDAERLLRKHFEPVLGAKPINEIKTRQITEIVDGLLSKPGTASHAHAAVRLFFRWAVARRLILHSPLDGLSNPTRHVPRDRVLVPEELKSVYLTASQQAFPFGAVVQLLILTGQRRGEIAGLRWEWIDERARTITLPASATKNGRAHTFPYGEAAAVIFEAIPRQGDYLFPAHREQTKGKPATTMSGWAKQKATLDKAVATSGHAVSPWTLHDLRRTFATNLAALGVRLEVTEKLLNHVSGSFGGIVGIYQRHGFQDEMKEAITRYEAHLTELLHAGE